MVSLSVVRTPGVGYSTDQRVVRGLLSLNGIPSDEDCLRNWYICLDSHLKYDEESSKIVKYIQDFYSSTGYISPPDYLILKGYFERNDEIEVLNYLEETIKQPCYIRTNYKSICDSSIEIQESKDLINIFRDAAIICETGRTIDRKTLRGPDDAKQWVMGKISSIGSDILEGPSIKTEASILATMEDQKISPKLVTGFPSIDDLAGGIPSHFIHTVVAASGHMKSVYSAKMCVKAVQQGWPVCYIGADEGNIPVARRIKSMGGLGKDLISFCDDPFMIQQAAEILAKRAKTLTRERAIRSIKSWSRLERDLEDEFVIQNEIDKKNLEIPGMLVIDSLQTVGDISQKEYDRITNTMRMLKQLRIKHNILILVVSESNRSATAAKRKEDRSRSLNAAKGSSSVEFDSDLVFVFSDAREEDGSTIVNVETVKCRLDTYKKPTFGIKFCGNDVVEVSPSLSIPEIDNIEKSIKGICDLINKYHPKSVAEAKIYGKEFGLGNHQACQEALKIAQSRGVIFGGNGKPMNTITPGDML